MMNQGVDCAVHDGTVRDSQGQPGTARDSQGQPGTARDSQGHLCTVTMNHRSADHVPVCTATPVWIRPALVYTRR